MKLQGSIRRFNLGTVLEFLAENRASGVLEVRDSEEHGFVYLVNGRVEGISLPLTDELLGTRLVKAGCVTEEQLREALTDDATLTPGQRVLKPLGQRLVEKGFTDEQSIRAVMRRQILDEVFELAHWSDGEFFYDEPASMPVFQLAVQGNVQALLVDAQRRIDQGERASKSGPREEQEVCFECPLESECTAAIKAKYLKSDICLWREMSAISRDTLDAQRQAGRRPRSSGGETKPALDPTIGWR